MFKPGFPPFRNPKSGVSPPGRTGGVFSECLNGLLTPEGLAALTEALDGPVGFLTVRLTDFFQFVGRHGEGAGFRLLNRLRAEAAERFGEVFPKVPLLLCEAVGLGETLLAFRLAPNGACQLPGRALSLRLRLNTVLSQAAGERPPGDAGVQVGYAWMNPAPAETPEEFHQRLFRAFCEAQRTAAKRIPAEKLDLHREFIGILETPLLSIHYQPVMDFASGGPIGWEALMRGPADGNFPEPAMLLGFAEEVGKIFELEQTARRLALERMDGLGEKLLFLNIHLQTLMDPAFTPGATLSLVRSMGIRPERVVMEISEAEGIRDTPLVLDNLEHYREQGFKIAIDDMGMGNAGLRALSHIQPDFIKIAPVLVRNIDTHPIKRSLVESFTLLSNKIGFRIIAEGVETATEYTALADLGVLLGQGNHFAAPGFPPPEPSVEPPPRLTAGKAGSGQLKTASPLRDLLQTAPTATADTAVQAVEELLSGRAPMSSVVVVSGKKPVGLVMNYNLGRQLGTRYGFALFYRPEIRRLMDADPLVVEITEPVEEVAKAATNRENAKIYDDIIVTDNGALAGTISVQKMLDHLAEIQVKIAMGANPLTGLPGNVAIEQEINRRSANAIPSSLIYVDLDNFKVYNDAYGFDNGDRMILLTARTIRTAVDQIDPEAFVGHVGGDDFVIICDPGIAETQAGAIAELFAEEVPALYKDSDRERGCIQGKGRDGVERRFPLVSVSIGIVDCEFQAAFTMEELSHRVAEIKKYAKSVPGNAFVRDRRTPIGAADPADSPSPENAGTGECRT
jgi:diguanylate cyclase (GGDEF)-like protein